MKHTRKHPAMQRLGIVRALPEFSVLAACLTAGFAQAQGTVPAGTVAPFELGTVVVTGKAGDGEVGEGQLASVVTRSEMEQFNRETVGEAVKLLPGASVSTNSRNEQTVHLRGFDSRQVPLFVDGIPIYMPYDGYVDFGRFTTFDLAEVRVAKGGASLIYGPNTLGGAINLVTRKPQRSIEGDVQAGFASGSTKKTAANLGSNQGNWYFQLGASYLDAGSFPLPGGFRDHKTTQPKTDTGDRRENAYRTDKRLSFKIGLTPNATDEYAIGYVRQEGEKGNPVYTGTSTSGIRYWQWPYWDKDSIYFIGNTRLGEKHVAKVRVYRDTYENAINAFTDKTYSTQLNNTNFPSSYDDETRGLSLELASHVFSGHELRFAYHYKDDKHRDNNPNSPAKDYRDVTTSLAVEDSIALGTDWLLRLGTSRDSRDAREVYLWPTGTTDATNGVAELARAFGSQGNEAYALVSHKTRFPTIKDRYSARMGAALANPDLEPESADHLELGLRGKPWGGAQAQAAVFYSRIEDLIQNVIVSAPMGTCGVGSTTCQQAQNVGEARHRGIELSLEQELGGGWTAGGAYTFLDRDNLSDASVTLTDTPRHRLFAHLGWAVSDAVAVQATLEAETGRTVAYAGSGKTSYVDLGGFGTLGFKGIWKPGKSTRIELGVANLGDKWYELSDGFPLPGRTWFANGTFTF